MLFRLKTLLIMVVAALTCAGAAMGGVEDKMEGRVIGSTGEILHISLPQPVKEGAFFELKILPSEPSIAEVQVVSCTNERPYIALAKVTKMDFRTDIPLGVRAYTNFESVSGPSVPKPIRVHKSSDPSRFSLQLGAFYPRKPVLRDTVSDYWQAYRLNYSFLKINSFQTMLSAEYTRGDGEFNSEDGTLKRTQEIIPITALAKFQAMRFRNVKLMLGAGAGMYLMRSEESEGGITTSERTEKVGHELSASLESIRGWIVEMRYRNVPDTNVEGYSLTMGAKF